MSAELLQAAGWAPGDVDHLPKRRRTEVAELVEQIERLAATPEDSPDHDRAERERAHRFEQLQTLRRDMSLTIEHRRGEAAEAAARHRLELQARLAEIGREAEAIERRLAKVDG